MTIKFHEHEQSFDNKIDFAKWFAPVAHEGETVEWKDGDIHIAGLPCNTGADSEDRAWEVLADRWINACQTEGEWA